jgi:stalled ribosome alternative rescue factor ArfA
MPKNARQKQEKIGHGKQSIQRKQENTLHQNGFAGKFNGIDEG